MNHDRDDRSGSYRRRLTRAAAASFALHMLLFGGLSVSRLDLAVDRPDDPKAEAPQKPKRPSDFRLQVSRSAAANRPAHEQPLELELPSAAAPAAQARERPPERNLAERRETAPEAEPVVPQTPPAFERSQPAESASLPSPAAAPARVAEVAAADASATADMAAAAAATEAASQSAAAPAAAAPRDRGDAGAVAARWRPREVALLEKLTARPPEAAALAARAPLATAAPAREESLTRQATLASGGAAARAETIAAAATQAQPAAPPTAPAAPAARETARRNLEPAATASRSANAAAEPAAAPAVAPTVASSAAYANLTRSRPARDSASQPAAAVRSPARATAATAGQAAGTASMAGVTAGSTAAEASAAGAGGSLTPAALASGRSGRQTPRSSAVGNGSRAAAGGGGGASDGSEAAAAGLGGRLAGGTPPGGIGSGLQAGREGLAGGAALARGGSRSPGRDSGSGLAAATGSLAVVALPMAGSGGGAGPGDTTGTAAGSGAAAPGGGRGFGSGESLLPASIPRGNRRGGGRSALAGRGGRGAAEEGEAEEGLSVSPADIAALVAAGRQRGGLAPRPAGPQPLERITAAALPADGRVRDVAEAFAGRGGTAGEPAGGITDREPLDRARRMVDRGLEFLARSQRADGRWRLTEFAGITPADVPKLDSDTAATGLALLAFLGAGHDHFSGPHRDTVRRGLEFLLAIQKDDGDLFLPADDLSNSCSWLYSHGIAAIAVCEAVGMTGDPLVKPAAEKACRFIATSRHPTLGGWRYIPRTDADLSVSGWMLVALRAGELGGVPTDPAAMGGVRTLLAASSTPNDPTRFAYNARKADQRRTDLSVACMTAVGTLMRLHTGTAADDPGVAAAARLLAGIPPEYGTRTQRVRDSYLWYYASQVLVHTGGADWQRWYGSLVDTLEQRQRADGPLAGSWDALGEVPDRWGEYGGRLYVTTLHLLALEVPWRHLPTSTPAR
jgi:hypothetical protein